MLSHVDTMEICTGLLLLLSFSFGEGGGGGGDASMGSEVRPRSSALQPGTCIGESRGMPPEN